MVLDIEIRHGKTYAMKTPVESSESMTFWMYGGSSMFAGHSPSLHAVSKRWHAFRYSSAFAVFTMSRSCCERLVSIRRTLSRASALAYSRRGAFFSKRGKNTTMFTRREDREESVNASSCTVLCCCSSIRCSRLSLSWRSVKVELYACKAGRRQTKRS